MNISGLQKLSLVDFPRKMAATVFTGGCNLRCPFCHNALLVTAPAEEAGALRNAGGSGFSRLPQRTFGRSGPLWRRAAASGGDCGICRRGEGAGLCGKAGYQRLLSEPAPRTAGHGKHRLRGYGHQKQSVQIPHYRGHSRLRHLLCTGKRRAFNGGDGWITNSAPHWSGNSTPRRTCCVSLTGWRARNATASRTLWTPAL